MIEHGFTHTSVITRLRCGPLGPHLDALATDLHQHKPRQGRLCWLSRYSGISTATGVRL